MSGWFRLAGAAIALSSALVQPSPTGTLRRSHLHGFLPAQQSEEDKRLKIWLDLAERHRPGTRDADTRMLASWSRDDLNLVWRDFTSVRARDLKDGTLNRLLVAAALLHTDVAMSLPPVRRAAVTGGPNQPGAAVVVQAGEQIAHEAALHWAFARRLLDLIKPDPKQDPIVRLWYRAVAARQLNVAEYSDGSSQLERARELFPDDAYVLFESGCLYESVAVLASQAALSPPAGLSRTRTGTLVPREPTQTEHAFLRMAEMYLGEALRLDPSLTEARVRLGRVLGIEGRHREAAEALERARTEARDVIVSYYANLFLGCEYLATGRPVQAQECYDHAAWLFPLAQSPLLALAQLAEQRGDRAAATATIGRVLRLPVDEARRQDPWWDYENGPHDTTGRLQELYHEARMAAAGEAR
jgi:tetratricopeptide (TPR) repeat protein